MHIFPLDFLARHFVLGETKDDSPYEGRIQTATEQVGKPGTALRLQLFCYIRELTVLTYNAANAHMTKSRIMYNNQHRISSTRIQT